MGFGLAGCRAQCSHALETNQVEARVRHHGGPATGIRVIHTGPPFFIIHARLSSRPRTEIPICPRSVRRVLGWKPRCSCANRCCKTIKYVHKVTVQPSLRRFYQISGCFFLPVEAQCAPGCRVGCLLVVVSPFFCTQ